jgi:hypothetical protein
MAQECARADVAERRKVCINRRQPRLRGRATRGKRLKASVPFGKWDTKTFVAGLRLNELTGPWIIPGATDREAFNIYIETQLAPTLAPGDVLALGI